MEQASSGDFVEGQQDAGFREANSRYMIGNLSVRKALYLTLVRSQLHDLR